MNEKGPRRSSAPVSFRHRLQRNRGNLFIAALVVGMVLLQWPMLKGVFYRIGGATPPASAVAWRTDFAAAATESAEADKSILAVFTASWCPPCQVMKHDVWPDNEVGELANQRFVPVLIDVDVDTATAERYGIATIPTILVLDSKGAVREQVGFMSRGDMVDFLQRTSRKD